MKKWTSLRLDNRGWGLAAMLSICGCLSLCLLISAFLYNNKISNPVKKDAQIQSKTSFTSSPKVEIDCEKYYDLEKKIASLAEKGMKGISIEKGKLILTIKEIEETSKIKILEDEDCRGYVIYDVPNMSATTYLNCKGVYQSMYYNVDFE